MLKQDGNVLKVWNILASLKFILMNRLIWIVLKAEHTDVVFATGTDEHGYKIQKKAKLENKDCSQFCDDISSNKIQLSRCKVELYFQIFFSKIKLNSKNYSMSVM